MPMLIVGTIVAGAVIVVVLFGGPAAPQQQSIDRLMQALEAGSGEKSAGILLPREKELWQTALELSERLRNKSTELTSEELETVSARLAEMVGAEIDRVDQITAFGDDLATQRVLRSGRFEFLIRALARTERPVAVSALIDLIQRGREPYGSVAIEELGNLHELPESKAAVVPITAAVRETDRPETLLVACTALSVLATKGDPEVVEALSSIRLSHDGEVSWSAALALARLGSNSGKLTLLDMLDRSFWETGERYRIVDESGQVRRYPMPPNRVDAFLIASIDAASQLPDEDLWEAIEALESDGSHAVRGAAAKAVAERGGVADSNRP